VIKQVIEPTHKVPGNENHLYFDWTDKGRTVSFSATWQGEGLSCHVGTDKEGKRSLRKAVNDFCEAMFAFYRPDCIFAVTDMPTVINLVKKCGFRQLAEQEWTVDGKLTNIRFMARFPDEKRLA
jgi:hypothetical protein